MKYDYSLNINGRVIDINSPAYFMADLAANHDGELSRAKDLIYLAKEAGADAVKFQHFKAEKIVSDYGFAALGGQMAHQAKWDKNVFDIYREYECRREWNDELIQTAAKAGVDFLTTPYDLEAVEQFSPHIPAYKIGSGDISWTDFIEDVARQGKPVLLATGAADMTDVERAVDAVLKHNPSLALMQCNTEYSGARENFRHINLKVLQSYALRYPNLVLGLSDHTPGSTTVLGAIALGARIIEKHFTDDNSRTGPDHGFSMTPATWKEMVERSRELEAALGTGIKKVEDNERDTVVVQRRCLRLTLKLEAGTELKPAHLECLRPAPPLAIQPYELSRVLGRRLKKSKEAGDALYAEDME